MSADQRAFARYTFMGVIKCFATLGVNGQTIEQVPVLNLSASGMFIWVDRAAAVPRQGDQVHDIQFELVGLDDINTSGQVVRIMNMRKSIGCGIAFDAIAEPEMARIDAFVKHRLHQTEDETQPRT